MALGESMDGIWLARNIKLKVAFRGQISTGTWVVEAIEFKLVVRSEPRPTFEAIGGCFQAKEA